MTRFPVFDGRNDTLTDLYEPEEGEERSFFERSEQGHIDLPRAREGGLRTAGGGTSMVAVPLCLGCSVFPGEVGGVASRRRCLRSGRSACAARQGGKGSSYPLDGQE